MRLPHRRAGAGRGRAVEDPDARRAGYLIGTADEGAAGIRAWAPTAPYTHPPLLRPPAGLRPAQTAPWLERFAREVLPRFKGQSGPAPAPWPEASKAVGRRQRRARSPPPAVGG